MKIALTVNGRPIEAEVKPRTSLADFLREELLLTGTHLGCEHGICGACTVEIDGQISRSCITYAVACSGAKIRTIEGFDADPLMGRLRDAFRQHHALQCGYCTPGMLVTARDLVGRKPGLARAEIRAEMSGNLCRCTGYMGIVSAIEQVMGDAPAHASARSHPWLGPAPGPQAQVPGPVPDGAGTGRRAVPDRAHATPMPPRAAGHARRVPVHQGGVAEVDGMVRFTQSFVLEHGRDHAWGLMSDVTAMARCMPGVELDGPPDADGHLRGRINVTLGPISAAFAGEATATAFPAEYRQRIEGRGGDRKSGSRVTGSVDYRLTAVPGQPSAGTPQPAESTQVDVTIGYALTGMLAQLGRSNLALDFARRLGETFAQNVDTLLRDPTGAALSGAPLSGFSLLVRVLADRLRRLFGRPTG